MLIKFFGNKGGGSPKASMDYLLREGKEDTQFQVLRGDPDLSQSIAESCGFKNAYTVGWLSFEEENIPDHHKTAIMDRFEKHVFAGLEKDQYNITWVEHTDKSRLELNFYIPNVELTSQKRLQPYYDKADRPLIENFKQVINHEYGLSDPRSPDKQQTLITRADLPTEKRSALKEIDAGISALVQKGLIRNRDDVIEALKQSGFEIARVTPKNLSIKTEGQNLRLKGAFYEQDFKFSADVLRECQARQRDYDGESETRYRTARERLESATGRRQQAFERKYPSRADEIDQAYRERVEITVHHSGRTGADIGRDQSVSHVLERERIPEPDRMETVSRDIPDAEPQYQTDQLHHGRQEQATVRRRRSGISERKLGREERSLPNSSEVSHHDRDRTTLRERLEHLVTTARDRYQQFISACRGTRDTEQSVSHAIQGNQSTVSDFNRTAEQVSERLTQQIQRQEQKRSRGFSIGF